MVGGISLNTTHGKGKQAENATDGTDPHLKIIGGLAHQNIRNLVGSIGNVLRIRGGYTGDEVDALGAYEVGVSRGSIRMYEGGADSEGKD